MSAVCTGFHPQTKSWLVVSGVNPNLFIPDTVATLKRCKLCKMFHPVMSTLKIKRCFIFQWEWGSLCLFQEKLSEFRQRLYASKTHFLRFLNLEVEENKLLLVLNVKALKMAAQRALRHVTQKSVFLVISYSRCDESLRMMMI